MDEGSALRRIVERIANNAYWDGPYQQGSRRLWFARLPHASGRQEVGQMELTEDRLIVRDYGVFNLRSVTQSAAGRYQLFPTRASTTFRRMSACRRNAW